MHSLVQHIAEYPPTARFFINAWTWGYEVGNFHIMRLF